MNKLIIITLEVSSMSLFSSLAARLNLVIDDATSGASLWVSTITISASNPEASPSLSAGTEQVIYKMHFLFTARQRLKRLQNARERTHSGFAQHKWQWPLSDEGFYFICTWCTTAAGNTGNPFSPTYGKCVQFLFPNLTLLQIKYSGCLLHV